MFTTRSCGPSHASRHRPARSGWSDVSVLLSADGGDVQGTSLHAGKLYYTRIPVILAWMGSGELLGLMLLDRDEDELLEVFQKVGTAELLLGGGHGMARLGLLSLASDRLGKGPMLREDRR